jgi:[acyl-carrier-protein] S-malonyltransferase
VLAFTFPGQGSQRPGMGRSWVEHPSFELAAAASVVTGRDVVSLLLDADQGELTETANAQLATFVQSCIVLDAAERIGLEPTICAGHSLGEYTALVAAGALGFEDGLLLVAERGAAMHDAAITRPGTMTALLGIDEDAAEAACQRSEGEAWVANFNAPGQVVIAGTVESVAAATEIARQLGAKKSLPLPVGGAFHTPLMAPARDRLRKALASVTFHQPEPVVVANVDARAHNGAEEWPSLLSAQLCSPVRWRQSLETLGESGARSFVELGPGGVLTGLVRRTLAGPDLLALSVATPADLERFVEMLAGGVGGGVPAAARHGEHVTITERFVIANASGLFTPVAELAYLAPELHAEGRSAKVVAVGDLIGHIAGVELRTPFAGTMEGILVLDGERVTAGQPVAWLRAAEPATQDGSPLPVTTGSGT